MNHLLQGIQILIYKVEYKAWKNARQRCRNVNRPDYKYYGGRGIEFKYTSFEEFLSDVGCKPNSTYKLDRIDNDGHYEIGNVKWSSPEESNQNRKQYFAHKTNPTNVLGVYFHTKTEKYLARAKGGKSLYYGESLADAITARKQWEQHGSNQTPNKSQAL